MCALGLLARLWNPFTFTPQDKQPSHSFLLVAETLSPNSKKHY